MSVLLPLLVLASASEVAERELPDADDAAALVNLRTGELLVAHHPKALARAYPPGSVLKLVSAYAALNGETGFDPAAPARCEGSVELRGQTYKCWDDRGHGHVDLVRALAISCNVFFYRLGEQLPAKSFLSAAQQLGFGRSTGSGLEAESAGTLPFDVDRDGMVPLAAGDSAALEVTPLQMLQLAAALAGRGEAPGLHLPGRPPGPGVHRLNPGHVDLLREAMRQAGEAGTLSGTRLGAIDGAGKTGTARWEHGYHTHAWFIGFAPFDAPRFAVVVFANKGRGAVAAAPPGVALLAAALGVDAPRRAEAPADELRVRVLEKLKPHRVRLDSSSVLACDDKALDVTGADVELDRGRLTFGRAGARCDELVATADARVEIAQHVRRYRGSLHVRVIDGELAVVNHVPVEDYLRGVVSDEQLAGRPEALKAQAVVSRTYALASRGRHEAAGYDLCDLTHCQLYRGTADERAEADEAVKATAGITLWRDGELRPTEFHSACGGATSSAADVFGEPASAAVTDRDGSGPALCAESPQFHWAWAVPRDELASALGVPARGPAFVARKIDAAGRVLQLTTFGVPLSGEAFHARVGRALGYQSLKSLKVTAHEVGGEVRFDGYGLGHGVGLCQYGARELDRRGRGWREILAHYFPRGELR